MATIKELAKTMNRKQLETFAAGLWYVANCDGLDVRERQIILQFLTDAGAPELLTLLPQSRFDPRAAAEVLGPGFRDLFMKAAAMLVKGDGQFSLNEMVVLSDISKHFGVPVPTDDVLSTLSLRWM
jgi:hypothetical protein